MRDGLRGTFAAWLRRRLLGTGRSVAASMVGGLGLIAGCQTWTDDDSVGTELPASLLGIGVSPMSSTLNVGDEVQFTATGFYSDQRTRDITDAVEWSSSSPALLEVGSGLDAEGRGRALGLGSAEVRAAFYELEGNPVSVLVTTATVEELRVLPGSVTLHVGETTQLAAEAEFSDGTRGTVTGSVRWTTADGLIATVDEGGHVTATGLGVGRVTASWEDTTGSVESPPANIEVVGGDVEITPADLRVVAVDALVGQDTVSYTVTVKNSGGSAAGAFWVDVWLNRTAAPPAPPATGDAFTFVDVIDAGAELAVPIELYDVTPGSYESWVLVDSFASVPEGGFGENNNSFGPRDVVVTGAGGPVGADLAVTYFQAFVQDDEVLYIVDIRNNGDQTAIDFALGVFANPSLPPTAPAVPDDEVEVASLSAGETTTWDLRVRQTPDGWWQSYALVDPAGIVLEPNESNNLSSTSVGP